MGFFSFIRSPYFKMSLKEKAAFSFRIRETKARALMSRLSFPPPEATGRGEKECSLLCGVWALLLVFGRRGEEGLFMGGKGAFILFGNNIEEEKSGGGKKEKVFFSSVMFPRGGKRMRKMKKRQDAFQRNI